MKYYFETLRLGFRNWRKTDAIPFARMNADPDVMQFFPARWSAEQTQEKMDSYQSEIGDKGYGLWAVEVKHAREFIGFIGFHEATFASHFTPCIEIGWRLDKRYWNFGYATEGAKGCLVRGKVLGLKEIYSFTSALNARSERVMQKIGMIKIGEFQHPKIENDHPLKTHVLYKTFL